jgi:CheY-like chemotaxis protein
MSDLAGLCILVVEDESVIARMLVDLLADRGVKVLGPVASVAAALAAVAGTEHIDAALLDVNLNGERSVAVAEALKDRGIPYVLATGYIASECKDYSAALVLQKPYLPAQLMAALRAAVG